MAREIHENKEIGPDIRINADWPQSIFRHAEWVPAL